MSSWPPPSRTARCTAPGMPPSTASAWSSRARPGPPGCRRTRCCTGRGRRRTGKRGLAARQGRPAGHLRRDRGRRQLAGHGHPRLRPGHRCQVFSREALWYGSFKSAPGRLVLVRDPHSGKPYDLGLFTLDTGAPRKRPPSGTPGGGPSSRPTPPGNSCRAQATPATVRRRPSSAPSRSRSSSSPC